MSAAKLNAPASRIAVALSGGVDSAVAAWRLLRDGHEVEAVFMKNWEEDDEDGYCAAAEDLRDAERICEHLAIPLRTINFSAEYWDQVFTRFLEEYRAGRTPNPDVLCNRAIKFDACLDFCLSLDATRMATGHYARIDQRGSGPRLLKGLDASKDQTYFLHALRPAQLAHSEFPIGGMTKTEVRAIARRVGLPNSEKKDSTGICFIGERPFLAFLKRYLPPCLGPIEDTEGKVLGEHEGLAYHTLGQRRGLGLGGRRDGNGEPWYVAGKDLSRNTLIVAQGREHPRLFRRELIMEECNWISGTAPTRALRCTAKTRYRQTEQPCTVDPISDDRYRVSFDSPQWAPAPGQSVVVYRDDECLGGGLIREADPRAA